jgi:RNase P subunit RPR2
MAEQRSQPDWGGIFQEIQEEMLAWRQAHPKATMREIELANEQALARLHARMIQDLAETSTAADFARQPPETRPTCPECHVPLVARGKKRRGLRSYGDRPVELERGHGICPQCGAAFFPSG